jgi:choline monooxygenase
MMRPLPSVEPQVPCVRPNEFDAHLPLSKARTIPARWYTDPAIYQIERERVFAPQWCILGRSEQVSRPNQFLTAEVAGFPLIIVRDEQNTLRGFYNVCRHRAAVLLTQETGQITKLRCRYHGWTYDLRGNLRGVPEFDGVEDFCREEHSLIPIETAVWSHLLAVRLRPNQTEFTEHLDPMPQWVHDAIENLEFVGRRVYELNCNWKVFVDNYLDGGYHVNTVHPELAGMLDYSQYRTEVFFKTSVQTSPLSTDTGSVRQGVAQYWYVFPNFMLNLYDGVMDTNLVLPLGVDRCRVIFDFYFDRTGPASDPTFRQRSIETAHQIQQEDIGICEEVQRGLSSGVFHTGRFSVKREAGGYHFHQLLARAIMTTNTEPTRFSTEETGHAKE